MLPPEDQARLLRAYPNAQHAVSYCEMFVMVAPGEGEESAFQVIASTGMNPREVVNFLRETLEPSVEESHKHADSEGMVATITPEMRLLILVEMGTADFVNYIAGKMGAM